MADRQKVLKSLAVFLSCTGSCLAQQPGAAPEGDFLSFFERIHPITGSVVVDEDWKVICRTEVEDAHVTFVGFDEGEILLVVLTQQRFSNPNRNLLLAVGENSPPRGTRDWGYVFDRNYDGKVDYLAFLDGVNAVAPDEWAGELPNLTEPFTRRELTEVVIPNTRPVFWHMADDNFDGSHDGIATSMRNLETGWLDGWVVARDSDFDGRYDSCRAFLGTLRSELEVCAESPDGYIVKGRRFSGLRNVPPDQSLILPIVNSGAESCELTGSSYLAR